MKFATLALVASVSAIRLSEEKGKGCKVPKMAVDMAFKAIDTNGNGQISKKEGLAAYHYIVDHTDAEPSAADNEWLEKTAIADAGKGGPKDSMSKAEFAAFANQVINHFDLCDWMHKEIAEYKEEHK